MRLQLTGRDHSVSNATNDTTSNEEAIFKAGSLQNRAENHDPGAPEGGRFPAPGLAVEENSDRAQEAANLVDGHSSSLRVRITSAHGWISRAVFEEADIVGLAEWCHQRQVLLEIVQSEQS